MVGENNCLNQQNFTVKMLSTCYWAKLFTEVGQAFFDIPVYFSQSFILFFFLLHPSKSHQELWPFLNFMNRKNKSDNTNYFKKKIPWIFELNFLLFSLQIKLKSLQRFLYFCLANMTAITLNPINFHKFFIFHCSWPLS